MLSSAACACSIGHNTDWSGLAPTACWSKLDAGLVERVNPRPGARLATDGEGPRTCRRNAGALPDE